MRRDEAGVTLAIDIIVPREDETQLLVREVYRDEAAFEEHRNNPSLAQFREDTAGLIAKFEPTWGTPVD